MDSLWTSKLRYGLQLWAAVKLENADAKKTLLMEVQKTRNKLEDFGEKEDKCNGRNGKGPDFVKSIVG